MKPAKDPNKENSLLQVRFSKKIENELDIIEECNSNNEKGVAKFFEYINWIKNYISKSSVAWDYGHTHEEWANGTWFIPEINVGYTIYDNTNIAYVYVFLIKIDLQQFGLQKPPSLANNKQGVVLERKHNIQSKRKRLSDEEYCKILMERYDAHWHNLLR